MRISHLAIAAMLAAGVPGAALAQTAAASAPATSTPDLVGATASHWTAAGFVGSNFSTETANGSNFGSSLNFGGQLAYLWRGVAGAEFLADFAPGLQINNPLLANDSHVYTYMANAIGALPLGADGQFEPYVSGGLGGVQLKTDVRFSPSTTASGNELKMGMNLGGGIMAFAGRIGVRGDVRFYKAGSYDALTATTPAGRLTQSLLSSLDFWRVNAGAVIRW